MRRRDLGVATALLASVLAIPSGPASADFGPKRIDLPDAAFDAIGLFIGKHVRIKRNTAVNPGSDGVFVLFSEDIVISERNTANDNASDGFSVAAGGIVVTDRPGDGRDDPPSATTSWSGLTRPRGTPRRSGRSI